MSQEITSAAHELYRDGFNAIRICEKLDELYPGNEFAWQRNGTLVEVFKTEPMRERVFSYVER